MKGTPVRGPDRIGNTIRFHQAKDRDSLKIELLCQIKEELRDADVFVVLTHAQSRELQLPEWVESHFQQHPGLYKKLAAGELVGMSRAGSSVFFVPIPFQGTLLGLAGIVPPKDCPQLGHESIEAVRQIIYSASPFFACTTSKDSDI